MITERKYGYIKDKQDERDHLVKFTEEHVHAFKALKKLDGQKNSVYDLRKVVKLPESWDDINQFSLGSCTANAIAFSYGFDEIKQTNKEVFMPSRLFIYYNERLMEGTIDEDSGAEIRDGIKSINRYGVCMEHHWIYDPSKFAVKPPDNVYHEAKLARAVRYARIDFSDDRTIDQRVAHLKRALESGFPFVFGFNVYPSFESEEVERTGMVPMPSKHEEMIAGHAVCAVGYDDEKQCFIIKNSWGKNWGVNGYFYMPYQYLADPNEADDFWVIQQVTDPNMPGFTPEAINPEFKSSKMRNWGGYCNLL